MKQPSNEKQSRSTPRSEKLPETEMPTAKSLDRDAPRPAGVTDTDDSERASGPSVAPRWQPLGGEHALNGND